MSDYTDSLTKPGEVNVLAAVIITSNGEEIDIVSMIADITLYEDLFSNTMSGYLLLEDSVDLVSTVPLLGQELFRVELQTPASSSIISKTFYIYKLQQRRTKKRAASYMLNFCSKEQITSINSKVARSYTGLISDSVIDIFKDPRYLASSSKLNVEKTKNSYAAVIPYWSPFETINWFAAKSLNQSDVPNYLFYETNQAYEFISVDTLIRTPAKFEYINADMDANSICGLSGDLNEKYKYVLDVDNNVTYDYLRNVAAGMYSGKLYTFDITTRAANINGYDYIDDFAESNHLNKHPQKNVNLIRRKNSSLHFLPKNNYQNGSFNPQNFKDTYLQRNSLIEQLHAFKLILKVHGRTDIKVGDVINYTTNSTKQITEEDIVTELKSDYFTGKYLITAIRHQILSGEHTMYLEIVSDSFVEPLIAKKLS